MTDGGARISGVLPFSLRWQLPPAREPESGPDWVAFAAGPQTDLFADPGGAPARVETPLLLGVPTGDYQLAPGSRRASRRPMTPPR